MEVIAFNAFVDVLSQKLWIIQSLLAWKICCDCSFAMSPKALCCHTWVSFWFKLFIPVFCLIQSWAFSGCVSLESPHRTVAKWSSQLSGHNFYFFKFRLLTSLDSHMHTWKSHHSPYPHCTSIPLWLSHQDKHGPEHRIISTWLGYSRIVWRQWKQLVLQEI